MHESSQQAPVREAPEYAKIAKERKVQQRPAEQQAAGSSSTTGTGEDSESTPEPPPRSKS